MSVHLIDHWDVNRVECFRVVESYFGKVLEPVDVDELLVLLSGYLLRKHIEPVGHFKHFLMKVYDDYS